MAADGSDPPVDATPQKSTSIFLQIVEHPDGSVTRPIVPLSPPTAGADHPVQSRDVPLNPQHNTWLRLYLPVDPPPAHKLPILVFFHGGGFVVFNASSVFYHQSCEQMARALPAVVVSLDYRLAPEHRLPAAYEDAVEAALWVRAQARESAASRDPWLAAHGDFSRCCLMGSSSGANMAYHAALRLSALELRPLRLVGLVLNQPYFGGVERTKSELASEEDVTLPLRANDLMWRLALPEGADRDHEYCNPTVAPPPADKLRMLPRCLVKGTGGDPLVDRQRLFVRMLEEGGAGVVASFDEGGFHAIELFDPATAEALFAEVREFVSRAADGAR